MTIDEVPSRRMPHPSAQRILVAVQRSPGEPVGALARRLGLGTATVCYHLARLEAEGKVRTVAAGRRRLVYPASHAPPDEEGATRGVLYGRTTEAIARAILDNPGATVRDLADATGEPDRTVYYHVKLLRDARLIDTSSPTRYRNVVASPRLKQEIARRDDTVASFGGLAAAPPGPALARPWRR